MGARLMGFAGLVLLFLSTILMDISHGLFSADDFANRAATSLGDERVSAYVADKITDVLIAQRPDLTAVRPLIVGTADGLVGSAPFRAVARTALKSAHRAFFSKTGEDVLLSVPDVGVLVQSALGGMSPELAAKIPKQLETVVAQLPNSRLGATVVTARRVLTRVAWLQRGLFLLGGALLIAGILLHPDRRQALMRAGVGLVVVALLLALVIPAGRLVALLVTQDPVARGALFGVWRAYFLPLLGFIYSFAGTGVILASAANSLHEKSDPFEGLRRLARLAAEPPARRGPRLLWILGFAAAGAVVLTWPSSVVAVAAVIGGLLLIFAALRELFRLLLENVPERSGSAAAGTGRRWPLRAVAGFVLAAGLIALLLVWRRPTAGRARGAGRDHGLQWRAGALRPPHRPGVVPGRAQRDVERRDSGVDVPAPLGGVSRAAPERRSRPADRYPLRLSGRGADQDRPRGRGRHPGEAGGRGR